VNLSGESACLVKRLKWTGSGDRQIPAMPQYGFNGTERTGIIVDSQDDLSTFFH